MVIFRARQNLANLNEVKMNLIVKFANLAGISYNIQFLETHNTIKNSLYACEKSKYQTEIMIFQN